MTYSLLHRQDFAGASVTSTLAAWILTTWINRAGQAGTVRTVAMSSDDAALHDLSSLIGAASESTRQSLDELPARTPLTEWPADWSALLGKIVTLEGTAEDAKIGAILLGAHEHVWIDGLDQWEFYSEAGNGQLLRVTGRVIRRGDLPVFVQRPGELMQSGIPVDSEEEQEQHRWRYLLQDATWVVIE